MVALFVLLTFVSFITIDFLLHRSKYNFTLADRIIAGIDMPYDLLYHSSHVCVKIISDIKVQLTLDNFAKSLLCDANKFEIVGDVLNVEIPQGTINIKLPITGQVTSTSEGGIFEMSNIQGLKNLLFGYKAENMMEQSVNTLVGVGTMADGGLLLPTTGRQLTLEEIQRYFDK